MACAEVAGWDDNGNGVLSLDELIAVFAVLEPSLSSECISKAFNKAKLNQDGCISVDDFVAWLYPGPARPQSANDVRRPDTAASNARGSVSTHATFIDAMEQHMVDAECPKLTLGAKASECLSILAELLPLKTKAEADAALELLLPTLHKIVKGEHGQDVLQPVDRGEAAKFLLEALKVMQSITEADELCTRSGGSAACIAGGEAFQVEVVLLSGKCVAKLSLSAATTGAAVKSKVSACLDNGIDILALMSLSGEAFNDHDQLSKLGDSYAVLQALTRPWCAGMHYSELDAVECISTDWYFYQDGSFKYTFAREERGWFGASLDERLVEGSWSLDEDGAARVVGKYVGDDQPYEAAFRKECFRLNKATEIVV
mmetsp:Transcript_132528/g.247854  ORF Transcript_132528/g.247854 Transcript_132528/m.247854 type:complete len:372 (+) Transcript_132528:80-1195(+)